MKIEDITDTMVAKVAAGIREYNAYHPFPIQVTFDRRGNQIPLDYNAQEAADRRWQAAIRYGLASACE